MPNQERSAPMQPAPSNRFSQARRSQRATNDLQAHEAPHDIAVPTARNPFAALEQSGVRDTAAATARNPFASLASSGQETAAATTLYEVPRELIEMARAHASEADAAGTATPLAPRPDAELEATVRAYTERVSNKPARLPIELMAATIAPEPGVELEPEPLPLTNRRANTTARSAPGVREAKEPSTSQVWVFYAALCMGLASCAHVLFGS